MSAAAPGILPEGVGAGRLAGADVTVVDLAQPLHPGVPVSPSHPGFRHSLQRRHGDAVRVDGTSGANDMLVLGTHTATHVDALAHISHDGLLHGGTDARAAQEGGRFVEHGVHTIAPVVAPGVLLDLPAHLGVERLAPGQAITADDLAAAAGDREIEPGSVIMVRTGWAQLWDDPQAFLSHDGGVPGPDEGACQWLAARSPRLVGSDTTAFEHIPAGEGHARLPGHRVLLVEAGVPIMEMLQLERLAALAPAQFSVIAAPLPIVGATGSPLRPLALVVT
ncbi:cyclase family protein [Nocardioides sp. dk4132]|uniref:cyclase family protein n=1 Tax=unclassified Nocardioides TaxID=2615069 RepID=UPI001295AA60|nr:MULTISPECIES: cyclase family protein [unclassified Nocardioides]MQW77468.1 cyclase family protein [Nocardioides sp. dk4132]QGA09270.1 cyclase family protein [Nocardioides sp. dk884]